MGITFRIRHLNDLQINQSSPIAKKFDFFHYSILDFYLSPKNPQKRSPWYYIAADGTKQNAGFFKAFDQITFVTIKVRNLLLITDEFRKKRGGGRGGGAQEVWNEKQ